MELYEETKNNYCPAYTHLCIYGLLELGCVYCANIYTIRSKNELCYIDKSLQCCKCGRVSLIPIVPNSLLVKNYYNNRERMNVIQELKKDIYPQSRL